MGQDERCARQGEEEESKVKNPRCNIGTWGTRRFLETLGRLGITHRRTAYHHPEGNSYIERFHRSLKEEEVRTAEYRSLEEARVSIARWIPKYNHDRPHRSLGDRTPREVFVGFGSGLRTEALSVRI
jgi:hypothetical protein